MKLEVPFYSQKGDDVPEEWRGRACGIATLKMALGYSNVRTNIRIAVPEMGGLIAEGVALGGYLEDVGWRHDALVALAQKYGLKKAHRAEFKKDKQQGIEKLKEMLAQGVIPAVSVSTDHTDPSTFHLVVLVGHDGDGFFYNDPAKQTAKESENLYMTFADFEQYWRGLAIFFG